MHCNELFIMHYIGFIESVMQLFQNELSPCQKKTARFHSGQPIRNHASCCKEKNPVHSQQSKLFGKTCFSYLPRLWSRQHERDRTGSRSCPTRNCRSRAGAATRCSLPLRLLTDDNTSTYKINRQIIILKTASERSKLDANMQTAPFGKTHVNKCNFKCMQSKLFLLIYKSR